MPHESPEEHRTFRFFSFFASSFWCFCSVPYTDAAIFRPDLPGQTVKQTDSDSELGTAATYLTTKFRQHDRGDEIFSGSLDDIPALCFRDDIKGKEYITYIYLKNDSLMELFTAKGSQASSDAGTVISQLSDFRFSEMENGFYHFSLESTTGVCSEFLLHRTGKKEAS